MGKRFGLCVHAAIVGSIVTCAASAHASENVVVFESGHVRPLALSPSGNLLFAVNTPDNRLEVYKVKNKKVEHLRSVPVGLEPVAVAARNDHEVWVVNHISDSVSIVDVDNDDARVVRTILVGDEPRDIVFAGAGKNRAFVTTAHRGQNVPYDPQFSTPGIGRADVWVYNANNLSDDLDGGPINIISLFTDSPRALAVSPNGKQVYAAGFNTGNRTSIVTEFVAPPLPPPATNFEGIPAIQTGLIVQYNGTNWLDELGRPWDGVINFTLPDRDVFVIDAMQNPPQAVPGAAGSWSNVGTTLYNMAVNPKSGKIYVSNTDARNLNRFEGPGTFAGHTVRAHHNENRITVLSPGSVQARHLNKHLDYSTCCANIPNNENKKSLALPTQMAVSKNGKTLYVAALGSSEIGVFETKKLEDNTFVPDDDDQIKLTGGGPTGVVLDEDRDQLYVLTRFDNGISVIDTDHGKEVSHTKMFSPEPPSVVTGRRMLYDARLSSKGDSACATCHVFGDKDDLSWDLGNPDDGMSPNFNDFRFSLTPNPVDPSFPPMKGPLATQSLRGMSNHGPMHWRGDRTNSASAPNVHPDSGAYDERENFKKFQLGFVNLIGTPGQISDADMSAFADFILQVTYPPNPVRNLDNGFTPDQAAGRDIFFNRIIEVGALACEGCHRTDPEANSEFGVKFPGFFGTDGQQAREVFPQVFKIPHFRNLYTKVGMFGMVDLNPLIETTPGYLGHMGEQIRGFGYSRSGDVDTLFRFLHATQFSQGFIFGPNPAGFPVGDVTLRRQVESYLLAFDSNMKPVVGQQITLADDCGGDVDSRIDLLVSRADVGDCDLVAKGRVNGKLRGYVYMGGGLFQTDRAADGPISSNALRNSINHHDESLTFTCAPPGTGFRVGVDRDDDNVLDGDDHHLD